MYIRAVREAGGLGDIIRVISVCQGLKIKYPDARVHLFAPYYVQDLIAPRATHAIDCYLPCHQNVRVRDAFFIESLYPHLQKNIKYAQSIDCWCPPYWHEELTKGNVCQDRNELWCRHGNVPVTRPKLNLLPQDKWVRDRYKKKYKKIIGIQIGATCRSREWPYSYIQKLIEILHKEKYHVIVFDVCYRAHGEVDYSHVECSIDDCWANTVGRLAACDLVVTPDSGFFHLAGVFNLRCLGLFGCTNGQVTTIPYKIGEVTHHYMQLKRSEIDYSKLPEGCKTYCDMRWERGWNHDLYRKKKSYCAVLSQLTPDMVFEKVRQLCV